MVDFGNDATSDASEWLASRLDRELSSVTIWDVVSSSPSETRTAALASRALELYRETATFLDCRADELSDHDVNVFAVLRGVTDAYAIESFDGWTDEDRREWDLPTRSEIVRAASSVGGSVCRMAKPRSRRFAA